MTDPEIKIRAYQLRKSDVFILKGYRYIVVEATTDVYIVCNAFQKSSGKWVPHGPMSTIGSLSKQFVYLIERKNK